MIDADTYLKQFTRLQSQILPQIYRKIFDIHLFPELREYAVNKALTEYRMSEKQENLNQVPMSKEIKSLSKI